MFKKGPSRHKEEKRETIGEGGREEGREGWLTCASSQTTDTSQWVCPKS
jgi:hypothetical protein